MQRLCNVYLPAHALRPHEHTNRRKALESGETDFGGIITYIVVNESMALINR